MDREKLKNGIMGFFSKQVPFHDEEPLERGHLRLDEDGVIRLVTLNEDVTTSSLFKASENGPRLMTGITELGGVLVYSDSRGGNVAFGGSNASVYRYEGRRLVLNVDPEHKKVDRFHGATALFPGFSNWADLSAVNEEWTTDGQSDGRRRIKTYSLRLEGSEEVSAPIDESRHVGLSPDWSVKVAEARSAIDLRTPLAIRIFARQARPLDELLGPLIQIQGLLSLAAGRLVLADGGRAEIAGALADADYWDRALMHGPPERRMRNRQSSGSFLFDLNSLGGCAGIRRWVRLSNEHPRAVAPVISRFRLGVETMEDRLSAVSSGIEYWVAAHRRHASWPHKGASHPAALALRVGKMFSDFVGDAPKWAEMLRTTNNALKHDPSVEIDYDRVSLLGRSGQCLLAAALLQRCGEGNDAARQFLTSSELSSLRSRVREYVATTPK